MPTVVPDNSLWETPSAVVDLIRERQVQRDEFGHVQDDSLAPADWIARLAKHLGRAVTTDPRTYRQELVVVGALTLAAIEAYDRTFSE